MAGSSIRYTRSGYPSVVDSSSGCKPLRCAQRSSCACVLCVWGAHLTGFVFGRILLLKGRPPQMSTTFKCPSCGGPIDYEALSPSTGTPSLTVRCPYCSSSVVVPEELRVQPTAPQPAAPPAAPPASEPPAPPPPAATTPDAIRAQIRENRRTAREERRQLRRKLRDARHQK